MFVAVLLCFLFHNVGGNAEIVEPQCLSSFDFLHKLMYKVIKVEEDVTNFKLFTDKLREDREAEQKENRMLLSAAIEAFTNTSQEQLKQDRVAEEERRNQLSAAIEAFTNKSEERLKQDRVVEEERRNQLSAAIEAFANKSEERLKQDRVAEEERRNQLSAAIEAFTNKSEERLKQDRVAEEEHRNQLSAAIEAFANKSEERLQSHEETSNALLAKTEESANALATKVAGLIKSPAVGFSVSGPKDSPTSGQLTFTTVITNEGQGFDTDTGLFTCSVPGFYYFSASLLKNYSHNSNATCYIKTKTTSVLLYVHPSNKDKLGYFALTNSFYVHLEAGETVKLSGCSAASTFDPSSAFSGFLVSRDRL